MSWIVLLRNPRTKALLALRGRIADNDDDPISDDIAEFDTEDAARGVAYLTPVCAAWGFQIVEIEEQSTHAEPSPPHKPGERQL